MGVPLTEVEPAPAARAGIATGSTVELPRLGRTRVGLRGRHQAANVAVADAVLDALEAAGIARVDDDARRTGYATATWPGRLELLDVGRPRRPARRRPQPGRRRRPRDRARGPARPFLARRPGHARDRVDGGQGRRRRDRRARDVRPRSRTPGSSRPTVDLPRAMPAAELAARWRRPGPASRRRVVAADPAAALELALAGGGRPGRRRRLALSCRGDPRQARRRPDLRDPIDETDEPEPDRHDHPADRPPAIAPTTIGPTTFAWGARTYVMGIVNVTPDSFSGDGLLAGRRRPGRPRRSRPATADGRRGRRPPRHRRRVDPAGPRAR